jgi:hypothetical protein
MPPRRIADLDEKTRKLIQRKLAEEQGKVSPWGRWLTSDTAEELLAACTKGKTRVVLAGEAFTIRKSTTREAWWVQREGTLTPCGWYTRHLLTSIMRGGEVR